VKEKPEEIKPRIEKMLEQEPLKQRGYKFVGVGADKVVLETPGSTRKIIKVSRSILRKKVTELLTGMNNSPDYIDNQNHERQINDINEIVENEKEAKEIFGKEHFLKTGVFKIKIPITKELLMSFVGDKEKPLVEKLPDNFESEIEMLAETQFIAEELKNPEKFIPKDFSVNIITHKEFFNTKNIDDALSKARGFADKEFLTEVRVLLKDERYKEVVREIISKIIEYTKKTGLIIDIFGKNNITIYEKENGVIDYHIIEALLPGSKESWAKNISQDPQLHLLRHYYVYYYTIKSIADLIGVENNLKPEDLIYFKNSAIPTGDWPSKNT